MGAEEFGVHAPRFVQRAAGGESFLITRRGKPMAGLVPPGALGAIETKHRIYTTSFAGVYPLYGAG